MAIKTVEELYTIYKKKKNKVIFGISFSFLLTLSLVIFLLVQDLFNPEIAYSLVCVLSVGYLVFIIWVQSILVEALMKYHYYLMLYEDLGMLIPAATLYTKNWLNFIETEFIKHSEEDTFIFYYNFFKKLPKLGKTGYVFVGVAVSKTDDYDFYNDRVNIIIEELFDNYKDQKKVKKQITIQFKKYQSFDESHKEALQEIINFKNGDYVYINLPVGYFVEEDRVYFLRPSKKFANKFYYYTCQTAKYLSHIEENIE